MSKRVPWQDQETWKQHGQDHNYNQRNPESFQKSKIKSEKSWYSKGEREGWLIGFEFAFIRERLPYQTFEEWEQHGQDHNYNEKNPGSFQKSKVKEEQSWYNKGVVEEWLENFEFQRLIQKSPYQTFEEWEQHGQDHNYNQRNPESFQKSKIKSEKSWYAKGLREKWTKNFTFKKIREDLPYQTFEEWEQHGQDHNYNERNVASLSESKIKSERSWYAKGVGGGWTKKFKFQRMLKPIGYWKNLENTVREATEAMNEQGWDGLPSLATLNKFKYASLGHAAVNYHGGLPVFRAHLNNLNGIPSESDQLEGLLRGYIGEDEGGEENGQ